MSDVYIGGKRVRLDPSLAIGKGGEADIYDAGQGRVLKVFKTATHPDLTGSPEAQQAAEARNAEQQRKLRAFPHGLPANVIAPLELATDKSGAVILGYTMPFVRGTELLRYGDRAFRQTVPTDDVIAVFRAIHATLDALHQCKVVIGDFNDLNVLVAGTSPSFIDADSFQFGGFFCRVFTERFVDPILCDPTAARPMLVKPHNENSDWYAFAAMLMQSLLFVDPYGGVYRPKTGKPLPHPARPMKRITVFNPDVRYPKPAVPYGVLSDDLLDYLQRVFEKDLRGKFPGALLESFRWTTCATCGTGHARAKCPSCATAAPAAIKEKVVIRGKVTATSLFRTDGVVLRAALQSGKLAWLYHEGHTYCREDRSTVLHGDLEQHMRYRLCGDATVFGKNGRIAVVSPKKTAHESHVVDSFGEAAVFDTSENRIFWTSGDQLLRSDTFAPQHVGNVLSGNTLIWCGPAFGFGIYRAGGLSRAFVFDTAARGINDSIVLPPMRGKLIDASCTFTKDHCWFFAALQEGARSVNRAVLLRRDGVILASAEADAGDGTWLSRIGGACAVGTNLFVPTDEGIVRVEVDAASKTLMQTRAYPDTEPFVDASSVLLMAPDGIIVVNRKEIIALKIA